MQYLYVKTQEKKRIDRKKYTFEQVNDPTFTEDYGRLINCGYVIFDFDEQPHIDIISKIIGNSKLKCKKLITTRGVQYMFKTKLDKISCKNHEFNWIGLQCDIKGVGTQEQSKIAYQAIKVNGKIRKEEFVNCSNDDEILSYLEEQNYITTEDEERVISENSDSIDRLRYFIGDTHSADVYRIDGYGNLENIDIDDLKGLCEDLIDELRRQIQTLKDSEMS